MDKEKKQDLILNVVFIAVLIIVVLWQTILSFFGVGQPGYGWTEFVESIPKIIASVIVKTATNNYIIIKREQRDDVVTLNQGISSAFVNLTKFRLFDKLEKYNDDYNKKTGLYLYEAKTINNINKYTLNPKKENLLKSNREILDQIDTYQTAIRTKNTEKLHELKKSGFDVNNLPVNFDKVSNSKLFSKTSNNTTTAQFSDKTKVSMLKANIMPIFFSIIVSFVLSAAVWQDGLAIQEIVLDIIFSIFIVGFSVLTGYFGGTKIVEKVRIPTLTDRFTYLTTFLSTVDIDMTETIDISEGE